VKVAGEILPSSSPAVTATSTCNRKRKKKGHKQLILHLSFFVFLDLHFSLLLLRICFIAGQLLWVSSPSPLLRVADRAALLADGGSVAGCGRRCWLTVWTALFGRRRRPWV
jgi:hypothetical protein